MTIPLMNPVTFPPVRYFRRLGSFPPQIATILAALALLIFSQTAAQGFRPGLILFRPAGWILDRLIPPANAQPSSGI